MSTKRAPDAPESEGRRARGKILVVDDDVMHASALRRALSDEHDVETTWDPFEALERIARGARFDVILFNLQMARMDGPIFHASLGKAAADQQANVVYMADDVRSPFAVAFLAKVKNPAIQKPIPMEELRAILRERVSVIISGIVPSVRGGKL